MLLSRLCDALIAIAIGVVAANHLHAEEYPSRNIRVVVPFAPAGVTDIVARIVFDAMSLNLGQSIVIENKPGASGTIATEFVADAAPDGYTLLVNDPSGPLATNVSLYASRNFDPLKRLAPVAMLGVTGAIVAVPGSLPAKGLQEFVALAKAKPQEILFGSTGIGTPGHLNGELFKSVVGIEATHVPYRVGTQGVTDLLSGRLTFWVIPLPAVLPYVKEVESVRSRSLVIGGFPTCRMCQPSRRVASPISTCLPCTRYLPRPALRRMSLQSCRLPARRFCTPRLCGSVWRTRAYNRCLRPRRGSNRSYRIRSINGRRSSNTLA